MKIAISATGEGLESQVDVRFGRCPYFVIVDIEKKEIKSYKTIKNTAVTLGGGAGVTAAEIIGNEKVDAVITVNIGPRAFGVLQELGIAVYQGHGKIKDVVQQFVEGKLAKLISPTGPMFMAGKGLGRGRPPR